MDTDAILSRLKDALGTRKDSEIAQLLGISPQNFSNRKKRGSLAPIIAEWAASTNVNAAYILHGEGSNTPHERPAHHQKRINSGIAEYAGKPLTLSAEERVLIAYLRKMDPETKQKMVDLITSMGEATTQ